MEQAGVNGRVKVYGGWFAVVLIFIFLKGVSDFLIAINTNTALNYLMAGLMGFVVLAAFVPSLKPSFRAAASNVLIGRGILNIALIVPYLSVLHELGPSVIPNMLISFVVPIAAGLYVLRSERVKYAMLRV